jgi:hypothetical protein
MGDRMKYKTNAEVLGQALLDFESLDSETQEIIADYIECCNGPECYFDGKDTSLCIPCKINWLKQKWEG